MGVSNSISLSEASLKESLAVILSLKSNKEIGVSDLTSGKRVNEEELYSAINYGVLNNQDKNLGKAYINEMSSLIENADDGKYSFEEVSDSALVKLKNAGKISCDYLAKLLSFSLGKATLDSNNQSLDTKKIEGSEAGDTPLRSLGTALSRYKENEELSINDTKKIKASLFGESCDGGSGSGTSETVSNNNNNNSSINNDINSAILTDIDTINSTVSAAGRDVEYLTKVPDGFVYKSESTLYQKVAIFLPEEYAGRVKRVALYNAEGERIEAQSDYAINRNNKLVYHFGKAGSEYPENLQIHINLKDGTAQRIVIKNPCNEIRSK